MAKCQTLIVLFVLGTFLAACRTTDAPADGGVIPILKGTAFYDELPGVEQAWWGAVFPDKYAGGNTYRLEFSDTPLDHPVEGIGQVDLYAGNQEARLEPFSSYYRPVIVYGKAELESGDDLSEYGTLYVGEIGDIEAGRIGCDPRRIPETKRARAVVVSGDCNHYLEGPELEKTYQGVLRVGERGPPPPPDRRHYAYFLDTEGGRLFIAVEVMPELERLVGREVAVDGKLVEVRDGRGPHQVLVVGVVREE